MKDQYKKIAKWYDKIFEPMNSGLRKIGMKMYPVKERLNVLDVGCGTGAHLKLYQDKKCNVFGVDLSQAMINVAGKKLGDNATLKVQDAATTGFEANKFDLILSSTVLHEMPEKIRLEVLEELKRILKNDGRILIIDFHPGKAKGFKGIYSKIIITIAEIFAGREHFKNYRQYMKRGGLRNIIQTAGLEIVSQKIVSGGTFEILLLKT